MPKRIDLQREDREALHRLAGGDRRQLSGDSRLQSENWDLQPQAKDDECDDRRQQRIHEVGSSLSADHGRLPRMPVPPRTCPRRQ